jgi:hypothetical protein
VQPIAVGGVVWWNNATPDSLDIVFDDSTVAVADTGFFGIYNSGGGNIPAYTGGDFAQLGPAVIRARMFPRAGNFHFRSLKTGISGVVVVQ